MDNTLNTEHLDISLQEVPGHLSLCMWLSGCGNKCKGCSTPELQGNGGIRIGFDDFKSLLKTKGKGCSCICFLAGDKQKALLNFAEEAKNQGFKTAVYTGSDIIPDNYIQHFDYIKYGSWNENLGPLTSLTTNQKMIRTDIMEDITYEFQRTIEPTYVAK